MIIIIWLFLFYCRVPPHCPLQLWARSSLWYTANAQSVKPFLARLSLLQLSFFCWTAVMWTEPGVESQLPFPCQVMCKSQSSSGTTWKKKRTIINFTELGVGEYNFFLSRPVPPSMMTGGAGGGGLRRLFNGNTHAALYFVNGRLLA